MATEPELLSWCCDAPTEMRPAFGWNGTGETEVCTKCGKYAQTRKVWNALPAPGSFEQQPGEKYREVIDWSAAPKGRRRRRT